MVEELIGRARRRFVLNEALGQLAFAAAVTLAGLALILVLGTRWLEWWTLSLFAAVGIAAGVWRVWKAVPDDYQTAVRLDTNAGLSDSLSTALYFSRPLAGAEPASSTKSETAAFHELQRQQAEQSARTVDLNTAVPFTIPRSLYLMAGAAVLASALLLVRFSAGRGMDLRAPLTEVFFEDQNVRPLAKQKGYVDPARRKSMEAAESLLAKLGVPMKPEEKQSEEALAQAIDKALEGQGAGDKGQKGEGAVGKPEDGKAGSGLEQSHDGDPMDGNTPDGKQGENGQEGADSKQQGGQPGDKGNPKNGQSGDGESLMSKLKDAVSNMMAKPGDKDKSASGQKGQQQQNQQQAKSGEKGGDKGGAGKNGEQQNAEQGEAQAGDPNGEPKEGQQSDGKSGSKSSQNSSQAGSGVGSQDGSKELKAAEQLKAMGKISEILGKRAASVTGETTIEVQSGNQELRTAYSNKTVVHGETDSDVSRDEIPVGSQSYVQQYFQQVRKSGAPAKTKAGKAAAQPGSPSTGVTPPSGAQPAR